MLVDDKSKIQIIENNRIYASNNSEFLHKDINNTKSEIHGLAGEIYKDTKGVDRLVDSIEMGKEDAEQRGKAVARHVMENPKDLGALNGKLDESKVQTLAGKLDHLGKLKSTDHDYTGLWQEAVDARKAKPHELDKKLDKLDAIREECDANRDNRLPDRTWSPYDDPQRYLDKGLQMTSEEREKQRELAIERGYKDPFER